MVVKSALDAAVFYVAVFVALAAVFAVVLLLPADPHTFIWLRVLLMALAIVSGFVFAVAAWRRGTDEVVREAHKFAALWGSIVGLALGFVGLSIVAVLLVPHHLAPESAAALASGNVAAERIVWMFAGALIVFSAWVIGYFIAWAAWWLRRR